jgi:hypothetical protein
VRLRRDAKIFLEVTERLLTEPILPLDYAASAADLRSNLVELAALAGERFTLAPAIEEARRLEKLAGLLNATVRSLPPAQAAPVNDCIRQLGRLLIPVTYTAAGRHAHDPALDVPFLPKVQAIRRLAAMDDSGDAASF